MPTPKNDKARAPAGGGGTLPHAENEKPVVGKWCYFKYLYKMTKLREDAEAPPVCGNIGNVPPPREMEKIVVEK